MPDFYPEQSKNFIIYRKGGVSVGEILDVNESNRIDGYPCFLVLRRCPETGVRRQGRRILEGGHHTRPAPPNAPSQDSIRTSFGAD